MDLQFCPAVTIHSIANKHSHLIIHNSAISRLFASFCWVFVRIAASIQCRGKWFRKCSRTSKCPIRRNLRGNSGAVRLVLNYMHSKIAMNLQLKWSYSSWIALDKVCSRNSIKSNIQICFFFNLKAVFLDKNDDKIFLNPCKIFSKFHLKIAKNIFLTDNQIIENLVIFTKKKRFSTEIRAFFPQENIFFTDESRKTTTTTINS